MPVWSDSAWLRALAESERQITALRDLIPRGVVRSPEQVVVVPTSEDE
jgi:hypothetical protein